MRLVRWLQLALLAVGPVAARAGDEAASTREAPAIRWEGYSDAVFARARKEKRFVLLDLEAVWCHWCHVMDETTYRDPAVKALLAGRYVTVRVDQDARPDLANRYEDYGWPATVVFAPDGSEIVKRQGYVPPKAMAALLQAVIDDPTPGPSVRPETAIAAATATELGETRRAELLHAWSEGYDDKAG